MPLPPDQTERRSGASTEALANSDRLARLIKVVAILLALYVAVAVTAASIIGIVNSSSANKHAAKAEHLARQARNQARVNGDIASNVAALVAQQAPCLEGDPPDSPACLRKAASDKVVADAIDDIKASLTANINTHDLNAGAVHDQLLRLHARTTASPRTPITSAPRTTTGTSAAPTTTVAAPKPLPVNPVPPITTTTTTTTTCVPLRAKRCR